MCVCVCVCACVCVCVGGGVCVCVGGGRGGVRVYCFHVVRKSVVRYILLSVSARGYLINTAY